MGKHAIINCRIEPPLYFYRDCAIEHPKYTNKIWVVRDINNVLPKNIEICGTLKHCRYKIDMYLDKEKGQIHDT